MLPLDFSVKRQHFFCPKISQKEQPEIFVNFQSGKILFINKQRKVINKEHFLPNNIFEIFFLENFFDLQKSYYTDFQYTFITFWKTL